jgi:hypothetical protein
MSPHKILASLKNVHQR